MLFLRGTSINKREKAGIDVISKGSGVYCLVKLQLYWIHTLWPSAIIAPECLVFSSLGCGQWCPFHGTVVRQTRAYLCKVLTTEHDPKHLRNSDQQYLVNKKKVIKSGRKVTDVMELQTKPCPETPAPSYSRGDLSLSSSCCLKAHLCSTSSQCRAGSSAPAAAAQSGPGSGRPFCSWWFWWPPAPGSDDHRLSPPAGAGYGTKWGEWELREETAPGTTAFPPVKEVHQYHYQNWVLTTVRH